VKLGEAVVPIRISPALPHTANVTASGKAPEWRALVREGDGDGVGPRGR